MMPEEVLVEQMLRPVTDMREIVDRAKSLEMAAGEKQALERAVDQYCLFKPVYYEEEL